MGPRYSFIGFDESTFHSEYQVRNMLGRLSSTDKTLRLRMRLASNQCVRTMLAYNCSITIARLPSERS